MLTDKIFTYAINIEHIETVIFLCDANPKDLEAVKILLMINVMSYFKMILSYVMRHIAVFYVTRSIREKRLREP